MSVGYRAVQWNRQKRIYDLAAAGGILLFWGAFAAGTFLLHPTTTPETFLIRGTALTALMLLHVILCIGPLARFDRRFAPLLYNRRHLGVTLFGFALLHAALTTFQFHAFGDENPLVSVISAYASDALAWTRQFREISEFPFEWFGIAALVIFFLMAATSHDFWLKNLGASFWKLMHIGVYVAYGLVILHVAYGALQDRESPVFAALLALGFVGVVGLHLAAGLRELKNGREAAGGATDGWIDAGSAEQIVEGKGTLLESGGQRIALFREGERIHALSNSCRHQGGPISEGRILNGCVTCPWHGWQYRPEDGISPPPFEEKLPVHRVRVDQGRVWVSSAAVVSGEGKAS